MDLKEQRGDNYDNLVAEGFRSLVLRKGYFSEFFIFFRAPSSLGLVQKVFLNCSSIY
jgi:hypothetical protein